MYNLDVPITVAPYLLLLISSQKN